jgi:hypothetical protein
MAQSIKPDPTGDTPKVIEDKVRALPANQGLNDNAMWAKIETEIAEAKTANKFREVEVHPVAGTNNKYGKK